MEKLLLQFNETPLGHTSLIPEEQEKSRYYSWDNILKETTKVIFRGWHGFVIRAIAAIAE